MADISLGEPAQDARTDDAGAAGVVPGMGPDGSDPGMNRDAAPDAGLASGLVSGPSTSPNGPDEDVMSLGFMIRALHNMIKRYLTVTMPQEAREATAGNVGILVYLDRHADREVFPQDLEDRFSITRSTVSRVLGVMERKGLIRRESVPRDARLKRIVLTDGARGIARLLHDNAGRAEDVLLDGFSDAEADELRRLLLKVRANLVATGKVCKAEAGNRVRRDGRESDGTQAQ